MFIRVETCLNLPEEGGSLEGISIFKPWKGKLKLLSCSGPSNSGLRAVFLIFYGVCSEAWLLVMGLKRQLSTQYHPRCLLYKRLTLLDFSNNLSPLHFSWWSPHTHSPSLNFTSSKSRFSISLCRISRPSTRDLSHFAGLHSLPMLSHDYKWQSDVCLLLTWLHGSLMGFWGKVAEAGGGLIKPSLTLIY